MPRRIIGILRVTIWVIRVMKLLTSPPDPPSRVLASSSLKRAAFKDPRDV